MSARVTVSRYRGATVVALAGVVDAAVLDALRQPVAAATAARDLVVIDLESASRVDPAGLRALVAHVVDTGGGIRLRLAARRNSTVALLARWRIHHLVAVHRSVDDAVAAQRLLAARHRRSTQRMIDAEVSRLLREAEERALGMLKEHRHHLDRLTALLLEHETVEGETVYELVGRPAPKGHLEVVAPVPGNGGAALAEQRGGAGQGAG